MAHHCGELKAQRPGQIEGEVEVSIALGRPDGRRKRDLDNAAGKAVLDLLVAHQVIEDDSGLPMMPPCSCPRRSS